MMKPHGRTARFVLLGVIALSFLATLPGCDDRKDSSPTNISGKKTPSEVLEEAKAKEQPKKP